MKSIFYLDTSGLNFLADRIHDFDAFKIIREELKFEIYLSSIGIWEVLLNSDDKRKDYLIYWAQFNCANFLLKSPTEIIIDYIQADCPLKDRGPFRENPKSNMGLARTWGNIHGRIDKTIPIDLDALKIRSAPIRQLSKQLKAIISSMCDINRPNYEADPFHQAMHQVLENLDRPKQTSEENERILKISLIFLFFIVCIGFELENSCVRDFWSGRKIDDPFERLDYLIKDHPVILKRGPLIEMAKMADTQLSMENSKSRGLLHDCFHSIYCYYADNFITGDEHFKTLREENKHPAFDGIIMTEQLEEIWELAQKKQCNQADGMGLVLPEKQNQIAVLA